MVALLLDDRPDKSIAQRLGARVMGEGDLLVALSGADDIREHVNAGHVRCLIVGASWVREATSALLACETLVPLIRLLDRPNLQGKHYAGLRVDGHLDGAVSHEVCGTV